MVTSPQGIIDHYYSQEFVAVCVQAMCKLTWRWKVKTSLMKEGYYHVHEECPVYVPLGDNRTWFDSLGNGISLHWKKCLQTPFSVKVWYSNNGLVWKQSVNTSWPNMIAHLLICPGSTARARDPWLPDFWLQQGQDAQHANMWRLSINCGLPTPPTCLIFVLVLEIELKSS